MYFTGLLTRDSASFNNQCITWYSRLSVADKRCWLSCCRKHFSVCVGGEPATLIQRAHCIHPCQWVSILRPDARYAPLTARVHSDSSPSPLASAASDSYPPHSHSLGPHPHYCCSDSLTLIILLLCQLYSRAHCWHISCVSMMAPAVALAPSVTLLWALAALCPLISPC